MVRFTPARTAQIVELSALSPDQRDRWRDLLSAPDANPFLSPTFAEAAAAASLRVQVCLIFEEGRMVAAFPFQFATVFHRLLAAGERVGGELSDRAGIVGLPAVAIQPRELLRLAGLQSFLFTHLADHDLARGLTGERPEVGLVVDIPDGPAAFWAERRRLDVRFVRDTERRKRKLETDFGPLSFEAQAAEPLPALERLIAAKKDQYRRTGVGDAFAPPWTSALLRSLAGRGEPDCTGILSSLHAGPTWVASHFGLRCGETLHYWFPVYNPDLAKYAPGRLLLSAIIDQAPQLGIRRIDRGEGDTPAKRDFATGEQRFWRGLWARPGLRSVCFRLERSLSWRLGSRVRPQPVAAPAAGPSP